MSQLIFLDLSENNLRVGSFPTLLRLPSLQGLTIQNNLYLSYPETFISSMTSLQNLTIDLFNGFIFGKRFLWLRNLQQLNFYLRNHFRLLNESFFGLNNSKISSLDMHFAHHVIDIDVNVFSPFYHLTTLYLNLRPLCGIRQALRSLYGLRGTQMEYLDLSNNFFDYAKGITLNEKDIKYLSTMCIKRVDLSHNFLEKISYTISDTRFANCVEYLSFGNNGFGYNNDIPLLGMSSYHNITYLDLSQNYIPVPKYSETFSRFTYANFIISLYEYIMSIGRTIELTISVSDTLQVLNISGVSPSSKLHNQSQVLYKLVGRGLEILDVSFLSSPLCENRITFDTKIKNLNLTKWRCTHLNATFLSSISTLETLTFQDADLSEGLKNDPNGLFLKGLYKLTNLDLGKNKLNNLHDAIFYDQTFSLRNLYIQDNAFRHIPKAMQKVKGLQLCDIRNNELSTLSDYDMDILDACEEATIRISRNPFDCTCESLQMIKWIGKNKPRIEDFDDIYCIQGVKLKNITVNIRHFELKCLSTFWLEFSASLSIVLILTITIIAICYRYRVFFEYLYIILVSSRPKKNHTKDNYEFDAFISYSNKDYNWVVNTLYKRLTQEMNMKVSIHDKDFIPGRDIAHEILRCIDSSRKVIFVVTRSFLKSDWTNYELEMARLHAFRSGRSGLIIILKDGLQVKEMPELLKKMWWKVVCAKWPITNNAGHIDEIADNIDDNTCEDHRLFWQTLLKGMEDE